MNGIEIFPLTADRSRDYLDFFDRKAFPDNPRWSGCYCFFPLHDPERISWMERTAAQNRNDVRARIAEGRAGGYLAYRDAEVIGWCSAGPWSLYPMLRDEPLEDAERTAVVFCFVVAPEHRGEGVATVLLEAACEDLHRRGFRVLRARPLRNAEGAAANHLGPLAMYRKAGFRELREDPDGIVHVEKRLD